MKQVIHFVLVADRFAARMLCQEISNKKSLLGVQVGTWAELLELSRARYQAGHISGKWQTLPQVIGAMSDAFWSASCRTAEQETCEIIGHALQILQDGCFFYDRTVSDCDRSFLSQRCRNHLRDMETLWSRSDFALPPDMETVEKICAVESIKATAHIRVYHLSGFPELHPWQEKLLAKLKQDASAVTENVYFTSILKQQIFPTPPVSTVQSALHFIQHNLFSGNCGTKPLDETLQWLSCRDYLEEIEVAVSMVQQIMRKDTSLTAVDFAIMIPDEPYYENALAETAFAAGLPLAGCNNTFPVRDLGNETLRLFLASRKRPAPVMALASLVTSPLMPWSNEEGMQLARRLMKKDYTLRPLNCMDDKSREMLRIITDKHKTAAQLEQGVEKFTQLLASKEQNHLSRARRTAGKIEAYIDSLDGAEPDLDQLINNIRPKTTERVLSGSDAVQGLAVFHEHGEPWQKVQYLFVLGFFEGHYPGQVKKSAVFSDVDLEQLRESSQSSLETPSLLIERKRALFKRQLRAAEKQVTFFTPARDIQGKKLFFSNSLIFMASLLKGVEDAEELLCSLDYEEDRNVVRNLPKAEFIQPVLPRQVSSNDLALKRNLLMTRKNRDGTPRPQSPSSLMTLMTSPLAWLLDRNGLLPCDWEPDTMDIMTAGTLAHYVMEKLFSANKPLPNTGEIENRTLELLKEKSRTTAPFLLTREWHVELCRLEGEVVRAGLAWRQILSGLQADVAAVEIQLQGEFAYQPIQGFADVVVRLPNNTLLVVDYKKSSSSSRRKQMESGYDCQAELYRQMIVQNGIPEVLSGKQPSEIGIMYFLMNDHTALTDLQLSAGFLPAGVEVFSVDVSCNAAALIRQRLDEVKAGKIMLNRTTDEKRYEDKGVKLYALDNSPLLRMFLVEEEVQA